MNQMCQEQFMQMLCQRVLLDLSRFLVQQFCASPSHRPQKLSQHIHTTRLLETLLVVPEMGTFHLEQVKHSAYFSPCLSVNKTVSILELTAF